MRFAKKAESTIIAGATDLALDVTKLNRSLEQLISLEGIPSLKTLTHDEKGWLIGAGVTLSRLETAVGKRVRFRKYVALLRVTTD